MCGECAYEFEHEQRETNDPGCRLPCPPSTEPVVTHDPWSSELTHSIEHVLAQYDCQIRPTQPGTGGAAIDIEIVPGDPDAAPIWVSASKGDVYLLIGEACGIEFGEASEAQLLATIEAVAEGHFSERVWTDREGNTYASVGTIEIEGVARRFYRNGLWDRHAGGRLIKYAQYPI